MRYFHMAIGLAFCVMSLSCNDIDKAFEDVQEEAPSVCKKFCKNMVECEWGERRYDYVGEKADSARDDELDRCIAECAFDAAYGSYVVEYDYDDEEVDFLAHVSGDTLMKVLKCLVPYYDCHDDYWGLDLDYDDEDDCEILNECISVLGIDYGYDWDDDNDYCESDGDEELWDAFGWM